VSLAAEATTRLSGLRERFRLGCEPKDPRLNSSAAAALYETERGSWLLRARAV